MLQCPSDNILVEITAKYEDEITFANGTKFYIDPTFNPNFHATSEGIVHSVPVCLSKKNRHIEEIIRPGDTVLFSYKTVGDVTFQDATDLFRMTTKEEGYAIEWQNQDGFVIKMQASMKKGKWSAVLFDKYDQWIAGKVGTHGECENWVAANFKFASSEGFEYDNRIHYENKELWKVDYSFVFAIRRKGHMRMVGDYVLVEPICEKRPDFLSKSLVRIEADKMVVHEHKGICRRGGSGKYKDGDVILFSPTAKEKYNIQGVPWYIVKQQYIVAKELSFTNIHSVGIN